MSSTVGDSSSSLRVMVGVSCFRAVPDTVRSYCLWLRACSGHDAHGNLAECPQVRLHLFRQSQAIVGCSFCIALFA